MPNAKPKYRRILLKLSGEALRNGQDPIDPAVLDRLAGELKSVRALGAEIAIVVGGGNIFRGLAEAKANGTDRTTGDTMGMLATVINLERGRVTVFVGGTGNPYCTTDYAAALRANEIGADVLMKATNVDGIYDSDPRKNKAAKRYAKISYQEALDKRLGVMDAEAFALCESNRMPILVFSMGEPGSILKAVRGESSGTLVS